MNKKRNLLSVSDFIQPLGTELSYGGTYKGYKVWITGALPFWHPKNDNKIDTVFAGENTMIVSPEKMCDLREECLADVKPNKDGRYEICQVEVPEEL